MKNKPKNLKELAKFLKKHGVYREFTKGVKKHRSGENFLADFCKDNPANTYISCGLCWDKTKKGLDFWVELNKKWIES